MVKGGPSPIRVLLVEDDVDDARDVRRALEASPGFVLVHVRTKREALELAARDRFDVCLLDQRLPDGEGVGLCRDLRRLGIAAPILLASSVRQDAVAQRAFEAGADDFIVKDLDFADRLPEEIRSRLGGGAA